MEINKVVSHLAWTISASKEQIKFLYKEMKYTSSFLIVGNSVFFTKSLYHLNMSKTLLNQIEKNNVLFIKTNNVTANNMTKLKNTYLQRCIFQFSMGYSFYKETIELINQISKTLNMSLLQKWNNLKVMFDSIMSQFDYIIKQINK